MTRGMALGASAAADAEMAADAARRVAIEAVHEQMAAGWAAFAGTSPTDAVAILEGCDDSGLSATHPSISRGGRGFVTALSGCRVRQSSTAEASSSAEEHARAWVRSQAALFGLKPADLDAGGRVTLTTRRQRTRQDRATIVRLDQQLDGKPVYTAGLRLFVHPGGTIGRVAGHLSPPWAIDTVPGALLTTAQAAEEAADHLGQPDDAGWTGELGVWDDAVHDVRGAVPRWVYRVRPAGLPAAPYVFVDAVDGLVLGEHARSAELSWDNDLTAAQKAVEAFHQSRKECTAFSDGSCTTHASTATYHTFSSSTAECTGACSGCDADQCILGTPYVPHLHARMLQYSTIIDADTATENQCDPPDEQDPPEYQHWSYCTYQGGSCTAGEEDCAGTADPDNDVDLVDILQDTSRLLYEWMRRTGWDDQSAHADFHRLRAVTDFCGSGGTDLCEIHSHFDTQETTDSPGRWLDDNALIVVTEDYGGGPGVANVLPFTVAHEASHGVDFAEGNIKASGSSVAQWISEGMADLFGMSLAAYLIKDETETCPTWFRGGVACDDTPASGLDDCPCDFEGPNLDYGDPGATSTGCPIQAPAPGHLTESLVGTACDSSSYHLYIITKLGELLGRCSASETFHKVTVKSQEDSSTSFDHEDLAVLFHDALAALPISPAMNELRDELIDAADVIEGTSGSGLMTNTRAAADAVGLWTLDTDRALDVSDGTGAALGSVSPAGGRDQYWFGFFEGESELGFYSHDCDFDGSCSMHQTGAAEQLATDAAHGPTVVSFEDRMFVVYADTNDKLRMVVLDENGDVESGWPDPWAASPSELADAKTDAMPALVRYPGTTAGTQRLLLSFKEVGTEDQDIRSMHLDNIDVESPGVTWDLHDEPTTPLETAYGLGAASSFEDSERVDADRVYVAYVHDPGGTNPTGLKLWSFDPGSPSNVGTTVVVGTDALPYWDDRVKDVTRPTVAFFREMLHLVVYGRRGSWEEQQTSQTLLYARCELDGSNDCTTWSWFWPLQGSADALPVFLSGGLDEMPTKLRLATREDISGTGDEGLLFRSKLSD